MLTCTSRADEAAAIAAVEKAGGKVARDEKLTGKPIVAVYLDGAKGTGAALKALAEFKQLGVLKLEKSDVGDDDLAGVKGSTKIVELWLSHTPITDKGLSNLSGLKSLKRLHLQGTMITDKGLKELRALDGIERLVLSGTKVTDAGLQELTGFKNLQELYINQTEVTEAGLKELAKSLPKCRSYR